MARIKKCVSVDPTTMFSISIRKETWLSSRHDSIGAGVLFTRTGEMNETTIIVSGIGELVLPTDLIERFQRCCDGRFGNLKAPFGCLVEHKESETEK